MKYKKTMGLFFAVTLAYFVWLTWNKLTEMIGDSDVVWGITGGLVVVGILLGFYNWEKLARAFT